MIRRYGLLMIVLVLITACSGEDQTEKEHPKQIPAIDSLINREIEQHHIPGAVVRVQQGDRLLHEKAYGYARLFDYEGHRLDEPEAMTTDHLFDLASLTKVFATTFGIMLLVDRNQMDLDDPISRWLPEFGSGEKKKITVRHLLTHSAGLYQWKPTYYVASTKEEQYTYIQSLPLRWPVGEGRHYSDLGFMLLERIIEQATHHPLDVFLEQALYEPMGLAHTTFNPDTSVAGPIAWTSHGNPFERQMVYDDSFGYEVDVDPQSWDGWRTYSLHGEANDGNAWYAAGGVAGHAGLFSTAADLQQLLTLLLQKGTYRGKQLLAPAIVEPFLTQNEYANGLGWAMDPDVLSAEGTPQGTFGHAGFTGTYAVAIPSKQVSIVILTNRQQVGRQPSGYYYNLVEVRQAIINCVLKAI